MANLKVEILREYPVGRRTYRVGEVIEVSADLADRMAKAKPPYAKRVVPETAPAAPKKDAGGK